MFAEDDIHAGCVCSDLRGIARALTKTYDDALAPSGLLVTQYQLLNGIAKLGPVALGDLAAATTMDPSTITRTVRPLLRAGYVRIAQATDDRRRRDASLTPKGRRALERARPLWERVQRQTLRRLEGAAWPSLLERLRSLTADGGEAL